MTALYNTSALPDNRLATIPILNGHSVKFDAEAERARDWLAQNVVGKFTGDVTVTYHCRHGVVCGYKLEVAKTEHLGI